MEEVITIRLLVMVVAVVGCTFGVWWRIETVIAKAKEEAMAAAKIAEDKAASVASVSSASVAFLTSQFSEYRIFVAENYVSKVGLREFREEVMRGLSEIKENVSAMHSRMDRVIEAEMRQMSGENK